MNITKTLTLIGLLMSLMICSINAEAIPVTEGSDLSEINWKEDEVRYLITEPDMVEILLLQDELEACREDKDLLWEDVYNANQRADREKEKRQAVEKRELFIWGGAATGWLTVVMLIVFAL